MLKDEFIQNKLIYTQDGRLMDGDLCVMMDWEEDLMKRSAEIICENGGKILNIGFGLGIVDSFIQEQNVEEHYIIECHPDVLRKMKDDGWYEKPNVKIIEGFWQDHIDTLNNFDGVYFDTWKECDFELFLRNSHNLLKPGGILSFFNSSPLMFQTTHHIHPDNFNILSANYTMDSEIIEIKFTDKNLNGMEQYWDSQRNFTPVTFCRKK